MLGDPAAASATGENLACRVTEQLCPLRQLQAKAFIGYRAQYDSIASLAAIRCCLMYQNGTIRERRRCATSHAIYGSCDKGIRMMHIHCTGWFLKGTHMLLLSFARLHMLPEDNSM